MRDVRVRRSGWIVCGMGSDASATKAAGPDGFCNEYFFSFDRMAWASPVATRISIRCGRRLRRGADICTGAALAASFGSIDGATAYDPAFVALYRPLGNYVGLAGVWAGPAGRPSDAALVGQRPRYPFAADCKYHAGSARRPGGSRSRTEDQ